MPPVPALTNLLYVDYQGPMGPRTMQFRVPDGATSGDALLTVLPLLENGIAPLWPTTVSVVGYRWRVKGSTFSLPVESAEKPVGTSVGSLEALNYPRFLSLSGRGSLSGAEVRLYIYGALFAPPQDYRFSASESGPVQSLFNAWGAAGSAGALITEKGDPFVGRNFANVGYNGYYQRKSRGAS